MTVFSWWNKKQADTSVTQMLVLSDKKFKQFLIFVIDINELNTDNCIKEIEHIFRMETCHLWNKIFVGSA